MTVPLTENPAVAIPEAEVEDLFEWTTRALAGQGAFADVFAARSRADGVMYAVKQVFKSRLESDRHWRWLHHEIAVSQFVHHAGCIRCHATFQDAAHVYLQLDLVPGGDLLGVLQRGGPLTERTVARFTKQILVTLHHLHHNVGIAHLDLKPENLLCTTNDIDTAVVRIGDFGFAKIFTQPQHPAGVPVAGDSFLVSPKGTYGYMCPELLRHMIDNKMDPRVTTRPEIQKMDLYSLGVVVHILLSGAFPHQVRIPKRQHLRSMRFGPDFSLPVWATISSKGRQFCRLLLESDAARRPLVTEALAHPWLEQAAAAPLPFPAAPYQAMAKSLQALHLQEELREEDAALDARGGVGAKGTSPLRKKSRSPLAPHCERSPRRTPWARCGRCR